MGSLELFSEPDLDHTAMFKDRYKGQVGVMVATGPSLNNVPLAALTKKYLTMSLNRITEKTPEYVPNFYLDIGINHFDTKAKRDTMKPMISHPNCWLAFLSRYWAWDFPWRKVIGTMGAHPIYGQPAGAPVFSLDPRICVGTAPGSLYPCLQVMYWLGFETVLLVGQDHRYEKGPQKHFYRDDELPGGFEIAPGDQYTPEQWSDMANEILKIAEGVYHDNGRRILNLTEGSGCTAFELDRINNWL